MKEKTTENTYVVHNCKNKKCNEAWIDVDLTNAQSRPPKWKYCKDCCEKYGYVNPEFPPHKKDYFERIDRIKKFQFNAEKIENNQLEINFSSEVSK